jgi:hypothetical protein
MTFTADGDKATLRLASLLRAFSLRRCWLNARPWLPGVVQAGLELRLKLPRLPALIALPRPSFFARLFLPGVEVPRSG